MPGSKTWSYSPLNGASVPFSREHVVLLGRQLRAPLLLGLVDLRHLASVAAAWQAARVPSESRAGSVEDAWAAVAHGRLLESMRPPG